MSVVHPVDLSQPLLVFGGVYGNFQALQTLIGKANELRIPAGQCICTGDVVAYFAQPQETINLLRDWGCHVLMGNCEEALGFDQQDCGCGFSSGSMCALLSDQWYSFCSSTISQDHKQWMANLPRRIRLQWSGLEMDVVHGSVTQINEFVFGSAANAFFQGQFEYTTASWVLAGHCGLPFTRQVGDKVWHNAGALGMPANSGQTCTWYSVLRHQGDRIVIEHCALEYDYNTTQQAMKSAGLKNAYTTSLNSGLWPSLDVLPEVEKQNTGQPIKPFRFEIDLSSLSTTT